MQLKLDAFSTPVSAVVNSQAVVVNTVADSLDLLGNAAYLGAGMVVIKAEYFCADFFNLKSGLAGEVLQKFVNYKMKLVIQGSWESVESAALRDFIRECNRGEAIRFE